MFYTKNMSSFLSASQLNGCLVIGTALGDQTEDLTAVSARLCVQGNRQRDVILVLGNEGHGVRRLVVSKCETLVRIPSARARPDGALGCLVDSLNVSVTGGIILHSLLAARNL